MAYTTQQLDAMKAKYGLNTPTVSANGTTKESSLDKFNRIKASLNQPAQEQEKSLGSKLLDRAKSIGGEIKDVATRKSSIPGSAFRALGDVAGGVGDVIGAAVEPIVTPIVTPVMEQVAKTDIGKSALSGVGDLMTKYQGWAESHPDAARNLESAVNIASILPVGKGVQIGTKKIAESALGQATKKTTTGAVEKTVGLVTKPLKGAFKGKTTKEILSTPANKLKTLSADDRKVFFDTQRANIDITHSDLETKIANEAKVATEKLKSETQKLVNNVDRASIEEAQALKPKVIESMRKNSDTYRKLVDSEINPLRETYVNDSDIIKSIKNKFPSDPYSPDPYKADRLIGEMNLKEGRTRKIGELYDDVKAEKAQISSGGKTGRKVFTASDMNTTDRISVLSDALKENGVDLKVANKFWSNYAPLRDKIIKNVQPFTPKGAETGQFTTFTKTIQKSVKGIDEGNKNFINATEDLLGTKIGSPELKDALSKLDDNAKQQLAIKIDADAKILESKLKKELANKTIDAAEFEIKRQAQTRTNVINAIKWITGIATTAGIIKTTGF